MCAEKAEVVLKLREALRVPVYAPCIRPDVLSGLSEAEISSLEVRRGNRKVKLGELFEIEGDGSAKPEDLTVRLIGDLTKVRQVGFEMEAGRIVVEGPIGLLTASVAKRWGAGEVMITDLSDRKLEVAKSLGVDHTVNARREDPIKVAREVFGEEGVDVIFECVGSNPVTIAQAIEMARRGATIVVVGVFSGDIPIKLGFVQDRELELRGTAVYIFKDFLDAIQLIRRGEVDVEKLVTKTFPLREVPEAFRFIEENRDEVIKVLIEVS